MKNVFDKLISRLERADKGISRPEDFTIEILRWKSNYKNRNTIKQYSRTEGQPQKV